MIRKVYNACWYLAGGLILLAAVTVTIIRLLLPGIDTYRQEIETLASYYSGYPISIESVNASWEGWNPRMNLEGVTLHEPDKHQPITSFDSATVSIALFASLWQQQVIPESLVISGVNLKLIRGVDGSISFSDETIQQMQSGRQGDFNKKLSGWLLAQPLISLRNSHLLWVDEQSDQPPLLLHDASINLRTWHERIQLDGQARLPDTHGEAIGFALDATGNLLSGDWSGQGYIHVQNIEPAAWPEYNHWQGLSITAGTANVQLWSEWQQARLVAASGLISSEDTLLRGNSHSNLIRELTADFSFVRAENDEWQLQTQLQKLVTWNARWPVTNIYMRGTENSRVESAYISHLQLADILPLSGLVKELPGRLQDRLASLPLDGELEDLRYQHLDAPDNWLLSGRLISSELLDGSGSTSMSGLRGHFATSATRGRLSLDTANLRIPDARLFQKPVDNLSIEGTMQWWHTADNRLAIRSDSLKINTVPQHIRLRGSVLFDDKGLPYADIVASVSGGEIEPLKRFLPVFAKDKFKQWVRRGLVHGRLEYGGIVLRGDLDDFPFDHEEGQFKINARFSEVTIDYDEEWPPVYRIDGDLVVDEDVLSATIPSAEIYTARISKVQASIPDLYAEDHVLQLRGHVKGPTDAAVQFLRDSPLKQKATIKRLLELKMSGEIQMALDMDIKLYPGEDMVSGDIELLGNRITAPLAGLDLHNVQGHVIFSDDLIESRQLTGRYQGIPVDLSINRTGDADTAPTILSMSGQADAALITHILKEKIPADSFDAEQFGKGLQGGSQWRAEIHSSPEPGSPEKILISSSLEGLAIGLPAPLGKPADTIRPLHLRFDLPPPDKPLQQLEVNYADIFSARYSNKGLILAFGESVQQEAKPQQILVTGRTGKLELGHWLELLDKQPILPGDDTPGWTTAVNLMADDLRLYNQSFPDTRLELSKPRMQWELTFTGPDIDGQVSIPANQQNQPLVANFQRLKLDPLLAQSDSADGVRLDPRELPPLTLDIGDFTYGKARFGAFSLRADSIKSGLRINRFSFNKSGLKIQGDGSWKSINNEIFSQFDIRLHADRAANMLSTFGYTGETIERGETNISVAALWPGSPMNFSLAGMNGSLDLNIKDGQFLEIEPQAGRLFGLLSIQALPRRLSLDFRDLFKKGFAFDRIHGHFAIEDGHAYTNDLTMEGPAALITITGRTGLVAQDYDQVVTVIPQISDSLPVASALFGPIGIGVGAVIFLTGQMFESIPNQINRLLGYQYSITGNWQDPVIQPFEKKTPGPAESPIPDNSSE